MPLERVLDVHDATRRKPTPNVQGGIRNEKRVPALGEIFREIAKKHGEGAKREAPTG